MYILTVEFVVKSECVADFMSLMLENAGASRQLEIGCRQFDVCVNRQAPETVFLYEAYDDRAAFDKHIATEHFLTFDTAVQNMVDKKIVRVFERVDP